MPNSGRPRTFDEQAILGHILELFRRNGYDNTTFEQLVADSGLSRSSLYNAFGGKKELMQKAMRLYLETEVDEQNQRLADEDAGADALDAIVDAFSKPVERGCKDCLVRKTMLQNASSLEPPVQVSAIRKSVTKLWQSIAIAVGRVRGSSKAAHKQSTALTDEECAAIIVGLIQGTAVIARNGKHTEMLRSIHSGVQKLLGRTAAN